MKLTGIQLQWFNVYKDSVYCMHKIARDKEKGHIVILVDDDIKALLYQKFDYRIYRALRSLVGGIMIQDIDVGAGTDITEFENSRFMSNKRKQGIRAIKMLKGR